jgi:AcrR family transcriptional regulator
MAARTKSPAKNPAKSRSETQRTRVRRTPEEARKQILEAAERVFATRLPDAVGLKDIAAEAGVSHALVTHYFGTYEALVEATLERRISVLRDELVRVVMQLATENAEAKSILAAYRNAVAKAAADPTTVRLAIWALVSGRASADDFFSHRVQGLKALTDFASTRSKAAREDLEFLFIAAFGLALVSRLAGRALAGALGHKATRDYEETIDRKIDDMLSGVLHAAEQRGKR